MQHVFSGLLCAWLSVCTPAMAQPAESPNPERREFSTDAPKGQPFRWTSQAIEGETGNVRDGLPYTWSIPVAFDESKAYDLLIVCHPVGKDSRWAFSALDAGLLGKDRIIVAPDGTSALAQGIRTFRDDMPDYLAFREFILEMTRTFPADRIFLYGYGQGGSFALAFAGQFPSLTEGVVVQRSALWPESPLKGGIQQVPIVLMHGVDDTEFAFGRLADSFDALILEEHPVVWLRPLYNLGVEPDARRADEGYVWCTGMNTTDPAVVLDLSRQLLTPRSALKDTDAATDPGPSFGAAASLLRRLLGESENNIAFSPLEEVPAETRDQARALLARIDAHARLHIDALAAQVAKESDFVLNGKAWLGHLGALREEFRSVAPVEEFVVKCGYDKAVEAQRKHADDLIVPWKLPSPKEQFELSLDALPTSFLLPGFPKEFFVRMKETRAKAVDLKLSEESLEKFENVLLLEQAWRDGLAQYRRVNAKWTLGK